MRIDLIPDVPARPVDDKNSRIVMSTPAPAEIAAVTQSGEHDPARELLDAIYDAAVITDAVGSVVEFNGRALEFLGMRAAALMGTSISDIISGADAELIDNLRSNLINERFTLIQAFCLRSDESYFPAEIAVSRLREGDRLCFFIRDITIRRQAEEMLRTEHNALQNAGTGIAITNLVYQFEYANPAFAGLVKATSEGLMGEDIRGLLQNCPLFNEMEEAVMERGVTWKGELGLLTTEGTPIECQVAAACNRNSDGEVVGLVLSFVDLSDRKRAESAVREAEKQRVMLESLGAACHHLGQPATVLSANLAIIKQRIETPDQLVNDLVSSSIESCERLADILYQLNTVNEYRTTNYLGDLSGEEAGGDRILDIDLRSGSN
jgi:PAS domain S-box-containing protein